MVIFHFILDNVSFSLLLFIFYFSKCSWALFWDAVNALEHSLIFGVSLLSRFRTVFSLWLIILCYWGRPFHMALESLDFSRLAGYEQWRVLCLLTLSLSVCSYSTILSFLTQAPCSVISWVAVHALCRSWILSLYVGLASVTLSCEFQLPGLRVVVFCLSSGSLLISGCLPHLVPLSDSGLSEITFFAWCPMS